MNRLILLIVPILLTSCNLAKWNQDRLTKKFARNGVEEKYYKTDEHSVHYFEGGVGDTVVLIHGFGGDAQITWYETILDMAKDHHIIAPDLLWFGDSFSTAEAVIDSQLSAMLGLLDDRKVKSSSVAGISYGGFVTIGLVYNRPELFEKVCLVDSPGTTYDVTLLDSLAARMNVETYQEIFVVKEPSGVKRLYDLGAYKPKKLPKGMLADAYELYFSKNHEQLNGLITSLTKERDKFDDMELDKFPKTLILWGEHDRVFPVSEGKKLAKHLGADFKTIPKAGHAANLDNFKVFQKYFREFIDG